MQAVPSVRLLNQQYPAIMPNTPFLIALSAAKLPLLISCLCISVRSLEVRPHVWSSPEVLNKDQPLP